MEIPYPYTTLTFEGPLPLRRAVPLDEAALDAPPPPGERQSAATDDGF